MTKLTFEDLRYANVQRTKEWDPDGKINALFRGLELAGEVGELCNMIKKLERERLGLKGSHVTLLELALEIADVQITLDLLAMHYCIHIPEAVRLAFNSKSKEHSFLTKIE